MKDRPLAHYVAVRLLSMTRDEKGGGVFSSLLILRPKNAVSSTTMSASAYQTNHSCCIAPKLISVDFSSTGAAQARTAISFSGLINRL
jgi:hypothetical protein